jgi:hypothetical protein
MLYKLLWCLGLFTYLLFISIISLIEDNPLSPIALPSSYLPSCLLPTILHCLGMLSSHKSSKPQVASGFDILSHMICHVHQTHHLNSYVFAPDQLPRTAASTLIHTSRNLKSLFTASLGKCAKVESIDPTPMERCFLVSPLTAMTLTTPHLATTLRLATMPRSALTKTMLTTPSLASTAMTSMTHALRPCLA